jgi:hypothetical protein
MDIERGLLRATFLDYPLSKLVQSDEQYYVDFDCLQEILRWRMPEFTSRDCEAIKEFVIEKLSTSGDGVFCFLCSDLLQSMFCNIETDCPQINFESLFRWVELQKFIEPDLVITAMMAKLDEQERTMFFWNKQLGIYRGPDLIRQVDTDLHIHLSASSERFDIDWLAMMHNHDAIPCPKQQIWEDDNIPNYGEKRTRQYNPLLLWKAKYANKSYIDWIHVAYLIRYYLFHYLSKNTEPTQYELQDIVNALDCNETALNLRKVFIRYGNLPTCWQSDKNSCNNIFVEERWFLYRALRQIFSRDLPDKFVKWVHLYLVIKNRVRSEYIYSNGLLGLENYNKYSNKIIQIDNQRTTYYEYFIKHYIHSNLTHIECILAPNEYKVLNEVAKKLNLEKNQSQITAILSMSKSNKLNGSGEISNIVELYNSHGLIPVKGVSFVGSDARRLPNKFYDVVYRLRKYKIKNLTYHVGEDFYDLVDGLRAIQELIITLKWNKPCRMAHLLALCTNAKEYYTCRHYIVNMPILRLYENVRWLCENKIHNVSYTNYKMIMSDLEDRIRLNQQQWITYVMPKSIIFIVTKLQKQILNDIVTKKICIETCPTSNLRIGYFDMYTNTPTINLWKKNTRNLITINTDMTSVLCTSLELEFGLVALALHKDRKWPQKEIEDFIRKCIDNANSYKF